MKTEVCITIDVEFSIAGAFDSPNRFAPLSEEVVNCVVDGREQGLGFIMDSLGQHGFSGTFFTEALQTAYFGDAPMARIVERMASAGHDVQLHLHPCWLYFRNSAWQQPGFEPNDACSRRTDAELDEMIGLGFEAFSKWGLPPPVALRTGGFCTNLAVYQAMARAGLDLASNIGLAVFEPSEPALQVWGGQHLVDGVLEVPVLSYRTPGFGPLMPSQWRLLTITSTSNSEMESLLLAARRSGVQSVVLLTHPFEFINQRGFRYDNLRKNGVNQKRLLHLLEFLEANSDDFVVTTFDKRRRDWLEAGTVTTPILHTPLRHALLRTAQNVLNDFLLV
ncbi:MAG: hypothetical protein P4L70_10825 [Parasulfuritortus sp.]|jgi:hypothetical protein|nr:hypothetical protein [Parasulfuritortus sp.]